MRKHLAKRLLYQELRNTLAQKIFTGVYPVGSELPSAAELAEQYNVSPGTAVRAIELLASEHLLKCRQGRRPRVASRPAAVKRNYRIAIVLNSLDPDGVYNYSEGPWVWTLHQTLLTKLLQSHNPALTLSYKYDWEAQLKNVDGVIALEAYYDLFCEPDKIVKYGLPYIRIQASREKPRLAPGNTVYADYSYGAAKAATYMLANGVKKFYVQRFEREQSYSGSGTDRMKDFYEMLRSNNIADSDIVYLQSTADCQLNAADQQILHQAIADAREKTGVICNHFIANEVMQWAAAAGKVPKRDFNIACILALSEYEKNRGEIQYSSFTDPIEDLAEKALASLYKMLEKHETVCENQFVSVDFHPYDT